jgi:ketosteroid isomerase-like protein
MTQENVETIRAVYDRWGEGDFRASVELFDPQVVIVMHPELPDAGDSVVVAMLQRGVGGGSGVETELRYFHVWSFRGGKAIRLETFRERAEALEAVGISA